MNYITASGRRNKVKRGIKEIGGDVVQSAGSMLGLKNTGTYIKSKFYRLSISIISMT